jgi:hypothetical protein
MQKSESMGSIVVCGQPMRVNESSCRRSAQRGDVSERSGGQGQARQSVGRVFVFSLNSVWLLAGRSDGMS